MKAHINGITVEGTPQEIMEYQRLKAQEANKKPLAEVCKEICQSIGVLSQLSIKVERMNNLIRKQNVSRTGEGIEIYGVYTKPNYSRTGY